MARFAAVVLLAFGLCAAVAASTPQDLGAAYMEKAENEVLEAFNVWTSSMNNARFDPAWSESLAKDASNPELPKKVYLMAKHLVAPHKCKEFVEFFLDNAEECKGQKGVEKFGLAKTLTDNLVFVSYAVFESHEAFMEHIQSEPAKKACEFMKENDIIVFLTKVAPVEKVEDIYT